MEDLEKLEYLGLVSKIASEIENYSGLSDKTLAEFVISIHEEVNSVPDFQRKLEDVGADFPQSLVDSIDRLILTLHPKFKKSKNSTVDGAPAVNRDEKARIYRGLAIPDRKFAAEPEPEPEPEEDTNPLDDTFAMLEGLAGKGSSKPKDDRPRSRSPRRKSKKYDYVFDSPNRKRYRDEEEEFRERSRKKFRDEDSDSEREFRSRRKTRRNDDEFRRPPTPELDERPVQFKIYNGTVTGVKDFGAFVRLDGLRRPADGLVHVSQIHDGGRVNHPSDLLSRNQRVKCKVLKVEEKRISLSMKEVDQSTGQDLAPAARIGSGANSQALGGSDIVPIIEDTFASRRNGMRKRPTSPEIWETQQLIASGVIPRSQRPDIDQDYNARINGEGGFEEEEDVDIELTETEPAFLAGQTKQTLDLSPIRILKAPEGSLARAATQGAVLASERRDLRVQEAQAKAAEEAEKVDLSSQWNDPLSTKRGFAEEFRNARNDQSRDKMPEWKKISTKNAEFGKRTNMSMKEQRESLPVFKFRSQLLEAVSQNTFLIVVGDTGSGKTTQFCQYLAEDGYANERMIGITQPRRVAAMSVAKRVAEEVGCMLGQEVGYTIRFEDKTSPNTNIKFMTDGILQREILVDPMLSRYSVIVLDEAHERTVATDVLFALLKKTVQKRPDLKVIVTSATMSAEKMSDYFNKCPIFSIPGRTHPVAVFYSREPEEDYVEAALLTVMQLHIQEPPGDCLVFLTGKEEIDTACEILDQRMKALGPEVPEMIILPIYSALPQEVASRIFEPTPPGSRKVILATNIAETSLTIDGITMVVDPGFSKQSSFDPKLGMDRLQVMPISRAEANQRSGRAGRTAPGRAYRLYTEAAFNSEMLETPIPEIQRKNVTNTILTLKAMGINDLINFDFMDPPPASAMLTALEELFHLSALDDEGLLTRLGRRMADFPMEPSLSKSLLKSVEMKCSDEVLTIVAMISGTREVFMRPKEQQQKADQKKAKFHDPSGDHITYLNVYNGWKKSNFNVQWCKENFLQARNLGHVKDVRQQIKQLMDRHKLQLTSCGNDTIRVRQAFCSGFFRNSARKDPSEGYKTLVEGTPVSLHPSSALFGKPAEHVIYGSIVESTKEYMHVVSLIEPKWLVEAAPAYFKVAPTDRLSKRKKAERIQPLHNKFAGEDDWRLSSQKRAGRGGGGTWG
ncbi:unnamed protein product [Periconia digitata]|uniref:RNA helicase n=1 Tax=Periconia digitata TaxID=1303443 RepID=A0A9W4XEI3_9PLEO|nr:unnamed protein product [Periconia digitata]